MLDFDGKYADLSRYTSYKTACIEWELWRALKELKGSEMRFRIMEALSHVKDLDAEIVKRNVEIDQELSEALNKQALAHGKEF